jgi:hypothetical protein
MWWVNEAARYKDVPGSIIQPRDLRGIYIVIDNDHDLIMVTRWLETFQTWRIYEAWYRFNRKELITANGSKKKFSR